MKKLSLIEKLKVLKNAKRASDKELADLVTCTKEAGVELKTWSKADLDELKSLGLTERRDFVWEMAKRKAREKGISLDPALRTMEPTPFRKAMLLQEPWEECKKLLKVEGSVYDIRTKNGIDTKEVCSTRDIGEIEITEADFKTKEAYLNWLAH